MTKEEILEHWFPTPEGAQETQHILKAMSDYAKQQAIAYCSWYNSIGYLPKVKSADDHKPGESYIKSHEELYNQFIESQNNNTK